MYDFSTMISVVLRILSVFGPLVSSICRNSQYILIHPDVYTYQSLNFQMPSTRFQVMDNNLRCALRLIITEVHRCGSSAQWIEKDEKKIIEKISEHYEFINYKTSRVKTAVAYVCKNLRPSLLEFFLHLFAGWGKCHIPKIINGKRRRYLYDVL